MLRCFFIFLAIWLKNKLARQRKGVVLPLQFVKESGIIGNGGSIFAVEVCLC